MRERRVEKGVSMGTDEPYSSRIRAKSRVLGWMFRAGDFGYFFGLLSSIITLSGAIVHSGMALLGKARSEPWVWWMTFLTFIPLPFVSCCLTRFAIQRSGIDEEAGN
jgi:hypothetical protein